MNTDYPATSTTKNTTMDLLIQQFKQNWDVEQWTRGLFTEKYMSDINIHWLKFGPPNASSFTSLGILYVVIMIVGIVGNGLVIFMYCRCKKLRSPANTLLVNLAFSDLLMLLKMPVFIYNCFHRGPVLGDIACRMYGFIGGLSGTASIGTLAAISFDRYYVIKFPLKRFSNNRIYWSLIGSWIYALSFSLIPVLNIGLGKYQYEGYLTSCSFDYLSNDRAVKVFILVFFFAAFVGPLCVIVFSYFKIVQLVVGRTNAVSGKGDSSMHVKEEEKRNQEIKLAITVLIIIFLWFFSWSPYAIVALLGISGQKYLITPLASMIPALFCKTTSAIDPYVYAISHPKFREELWKLLGLTKKNKHNGKVWTVQSQFPDSLNFRSEYYISDDDDVEEETVEIELKTIENSMQCSRREFEVEEFKVKGREMKKQASKRSLLCLNPTFSNRTSSFRRLSRSLKSWEKETKDSQIKL